MVEFSARSLRILVLYRDLYLITYLEVDLSAVSIRTPTSLFLSLLHNRTSRIPPLVHYLSEVLGLISIQPFSSGCGLLRPSPIEGRPRRVSVKQFEG